MLDQYFRDIYKTYKAGDATEASYYPDLKALLGAFLESKKIDPNITIQPRKTKAGIPDFTVRKGKELIGYVEAKDLTIENLQTVESTEQIKRYKEKLPNFILTNYFDFWLWRRDGIDEKKGQWIKKIRIGQPITLKLNTPPPPQKEKEFSELLEAFFSYYLPERKTAKSLAIELASRAQLLYPYIVDELNNDVETEIDRIYDAFKEYLISDLKKEDFADIYAQTITYGLFTARLRYDGKDFNRFLAQELIPKNIQILHDTFNLISHEKLTESLAWIIDDMATVLAHADIERIREELHREKGSDDPLMHFYETFLAEYDPKKRKARGVYYTPSPVVSFIARSINILLKEKFGKTQGFANDGVTLLDPASGTLTFPANAIMIAKEEVDKSNNAGSWLQIVKNHILKNYYAFELLMAPYIIGHLKISLLLEDLKYKLEDSDEIKLYLTNTLDLSEPKIQSLPAPGLVHSLTEEAKKAKEIKEKTSILVVMGNPPYSSSSTNIIKEESDFKELYESYKEKVRKEEKNIRPLSDDYIKFIAFAHWKVKQAGQGIVGMITNNSYLDGLIHRDMRYKLTEDFNEIYILNLHGNLKSKEKAPSGGKDENVFDIQQGVGIILLVKKEGLERKIRYFDSYGSREDKYEFLKKYNVKSTEWQELELREPNYFFITNITKNINNEKIYEKFISVKEIFNNFNRCVVTSRDDFIISEKKDDLKRKIVMFADPNLDDGFIKDGLRVKDGKSWKVSEARKKIIQKGIKDDLFIGYLYRPFDKRYIYYEEVLLERARKEIMKNMLKNNIALLLMRQVYWDKSYSHFLVTDSVTDSRVFISNRGAADIFPLYLYDDNNKVKRITGGQEKLDLPGIQHTLRTKKDREENINKKIIDILGKTFNLKLAPENIFYYIYGILYSNSYRKKYEEYLKIDFPKIPFTKNEKIFNEVSELGKELIGLHLLNSRKLEKPIAKFPTVGSNTVEKREYSFKERRIYINGKQYFEGVEPEVWNYYIGGYQVLDKWLKDKIDQALSSEDVDHYLKVITSLKYTIDLQREIDKLYLEIEKNLIKAEDFNGK